MILGLFLSGNTFAKKPKKSPLLKLPRLLQYEHYVVSEGKNIKMKIDFQKNKIDFCTEAKMKNNGDETDFSSHPRV